MKIIELDLTGCKYLDELHERIRTAFNFPEWYGKNWDAFWDLLWSECDADKVIIRGENTLPNDFNTSLSKMHEVLDDNIEFRKENDLNAFSYEIID
ncbi:MAG: barstar family protein [Clostridia bacterium]|nr:barstar family protein [Clostridia bacterium]